MRNMKLITLLTLLLLAVATNVKAQTVPDEARTFLWKLNTSGVMHTKCESQQYSTTGGTFDGWWMLEYPGDFNDDGIDDIVWHQIKPDHVLAGAVVTWLMKDDCSLLEANVAGIENETVDCPGPDCRLKWLIKVVMRDRFTWRFNKLP